MSLLEQVIRPEILALQAYHVADSTGLIKLDAMENPYTLPEHLLDVMAQRLARAALNRYPLPTYLDLKAKLCATQGVPSGFGLVLGNGSDELISMLAMACAKPGATILAPVPGFVMYAMSAKLAGLGFVGVDLCPDFTLDLPAMLAAIALHRPAITYLAYPNNPTGGLYDVGAIEAIIAAVGESGIVVVDEAYQPFAQTSFMPRLPEFENLVVMRTLSKLGLAGIRLGYMSAHPALLHEIDKVRPPYNVNVLTQTAAEFVLEHVTILDAQATSLRAERARLTLALAALPEVDVFPSAANFLLIRMAGGGDRATLIFDRLRDRQILVKNIGKMHPLLENCLRVTVSTPHENTQFLDALSASLSF